MWDFHYYLGCSGASHATFDKMQQLQATQQTSSVRFCITDITHDFTEEVDETNYELVGAGSKLGYIFGFVNTKVVHWVSYDSLKKETPIALPSALLAVVGGLDKVFVFCVNGEVKEIASGDGQHDAMWASGLKIEHVVPSQLPIEVNDCELFLGLVQTSERVLSLLEGPAGQIRTQKLPIKLGSRAKIFSVSGVPTVAWLDGATVSGFYLKQGGPETFSQALCAEAAEIDQLQLTYLGPQGAVCTKIDADNTTVFVATPRGVFSFNNSEVVMADVSVEALPLAQSTKGIALLINCGQPVIVELNERLEPRTNVLPNPVHENYTSTAPIVDEGQLDPDRGFLLRLPASNLTPPVLRCTKFGLVGLQFDVEKQDAPLERNKESWNPAVQEACLEKQPMYLWVTRGYNKDKIFSHYVTTGLLCRPDAPLIQDFSSFEAACLEPAGPQDWASDSVLAGLREQYSSLVVPEPAQEQMQAEEQLLEKVEEAIKVEVETEKEKTEQRGELQPVDKDAIKKAMQANEAKAAQLKEKQARLETQKEAAVQMKQRLEMLRKQHEEIDLELKKTYQVGYRLAQGTPIHLHSHNEKTITFKPIPQRQMLQQLNADLPDLRSVQSLGQPCGMVLGPSTGLRFGEVCGMVPVEYRNKRIVMREFQREGMLDFGAELSWQRGPIFEQE